MIPIMIKQIWIVIAFMISATILFIVGVMVLWIIAQVIFGLLHKEE